MAGTTLRLSFCLNAGAKAGKPIATIAVTDLSTEALLTAASNKLRLKKKDVANAKLFLWCKDARGGTELPRGGTETSLRNDDLIAVSVGEAYTGPAAKKPAVDAQAASSEEAAAAPPAAKQRRLPPLISGSDDSGRTFESLEALWLEQARHHARYYAANDEWWDADGYGGANDDEAMIGDGGSEEDAAHSLAFLDAVRQLRPEWRLRTAIDAGAGVGRVTKHVLLRRCDHVCLVEACERWLKQSRRYLGNKRASKCAFLHARLEDLTLQHSLTHKAQASVPQYDLVWVQWTLQYLVDAHAVSALRALAGCLGPGGVLILKENRPCPQTGSGATSSEAFRVDTPEGAHGRYDVTRPDAHHEWLFECAGLAVAHAERGCVHGEVTAWALVASGTRRVVTSYHEWRRPHRLGDSVQQQQGQARECEGIVQPLLDVAAMAEAVEARARDRREQHEPDPDEAPRGGPASAAPPRAVPGAAPAGAAVDGTSAARPPAEEGLGIDEATEGIAAVDVS